jgi:hypothetical protein
MSLLSQLSSQVGDRSNAATHVVAEQCLQNPDLLKEIVSGFSHKDKKIAVDCAELMTYVSERKPELVAPYLGEMLSLLTHKETKARWETLHTLAQVAHLVPKAVESVLHELEAFIEKDKSVIIRDYTTESVARYAGTSPEAARKALPFLKFVLEKWGDKHAGRVMEGMLRIYQQIPSLKIELLPYAEAYVGSPKGVNRKAATKLLKALR